MTENKKDNNLEQLDEDPLAFMDQTFQPPAPQKIVTIDQETNQILTPIPSDQCHSPASYVFNREDSDEEIEQSGVADQQKPRKMSDGVPIHI